MNVIACCTPPAARSVQEATGAVPFVFPPMDADIDPELLSGADLLYIRLHGSDVVRDQWFGEDERGVLTLAIDHETLAQADLTGTVVVLANCYGDQSELISALYGAGAQAVIAGPGENYALGKRVAGTDRLVSLIIRFMQAGNSLHLALTKARARLLLTAYRLPDRDALAFHTIKRIPKTDLRKEQAT